MNSEDKLKAIIEMVEAQANDWGLWFDAQYSTELYLQEALRELHALIEK